MLPTPTVKVEASPSLKHFLQLARRGRIRGCSTYERVARKIAVAVLESAGGFDGQAIEGMLEFARLAPANYGRFLEILEIDG